MTHLGIMHPLQPFFLLRLQEVISKSNFNHHPFTGGVINKQIHVLVQRKYENLFLNER